MVERNESSVYDAVIIGAGFYGLSIALFLMEEIGLERLLIIEKESEIMARASYFNQARVHNGYHYPRSILTGHRSAVNFPRFVSDFEEAIVNDFEKHYAVAKNLSKVNEKQFLRFCQKIGIEIDEAPPNVKAHFANGMVDNVFRVQEYAFNSHILRDLLLKRLYKYPGITIHKEEEVKNISPVVGGDVVVVTDSQHYIAQHVFNCTYSSLNTLHRASGLPLLKLKHEVTEICLIKLPSVLGNFSITVMDGPFFSIMPFPSKGLHSLSHVRYTPHQSWMDDETVEHSQMDTHRYFDSLPRKSNYRQMYADAVRFLPALKAMEHVESMWEVKTVLVKSEEDDSRPILFQPHFGIRNYTCIMGGKVDNVYDVFEELAKIYDKA